MELYSQRHFPWGTIFWGIVASALFVVSFAVRDDNWAIGSIAPALLAFGLFIASRREFRCWLRDDCLEVEKPAMKVPYSEIEGLTINGFSVDPDLPKLKKGAILAIHPRGVIEIPSSINAPIQKVYQAILAMLPLTGSGELSQPFADHFEKEAAIFGRERVHSFRYRRVIGRRASTRRGQICAIMLFVSGLAWCAIYAVLSKTPDSRHYGHWLSLGIILSLFSFITGLLLLVRQQPLEGEQRSLKNCEMIISPTGIALRQGDLQGHLRWEELRDVQLCKLRFLPQCYAGTPGSLQLTTTDTRTRIPDVYDRPLALIYKLIRAYWKGV